MPRLNLHSSARGNTFLESAVTLTQDIRWEIQSLSVRCSKAANEEELLNRGSKRAKSREQNELELKLVISDIKQLLDRIEDAVPLINLAITTSGVNLSTNLSASISPSRLLQASTFITAADSIYADHPGTPVQVGPIYTLSMYMLFAGHANRPHDETSIRETTWKEVIHKARVKLVRVPLKSLYHLPEDNHTDAQTSGFFPHSFPDDGNSVEFAYQLKFVEDLNDGRVHTFEEDEPQPGPFEDVALAGIRDLIPIHQVEKIFYADTGKILNIGTDGETNNPVLLIKRNIHAEPPRAMMQRQGSSDSDVDSEHDVRSGEELYRDTDGVVDGEELYRNTNGVVDDNDDDDDAAQLSAQFLRESTPNTPSIEDPQKLLEDLQPESPQLNDVQYHWRLPVDLDPEWIAFEVYTEEADTDDEDDSETADSRPQSSRHGSLDPGISSAFANLNLRSSAATPPRSSRYHAQRSRALATNGQVKSSLSLLEMLIRLSSLQQYRQASHLTVEDEYLNFFLEDSSNTGAGANGEYRQRLRHDARRRVGFDPYNESPIKRRGEEYLAHPRAATENWEDRVVRENSYFEGGSRYGSPGREYVRDSVEDFPRLVLPDTSPTTPSPLFRPHLSPTRSSPAAVRSSSARSSQNMATPPTSVNKSRKAVLRGQREGRPGSPLARQVRETKESLIPTDIASSERQAVYGNDEE